MLIKTLMNSIEPLTGFVYHAVTPVKDSKGKVNRIEVEIRPRKGSQGICSQCHVRRPGYDLLKPRLFQFVPVWGIPVLLLYAMRRVKCPVCGVKVELVPWATGKSPVTRSLAVFLGRWARLLSWQEVSRQFGVNWHQVFDSVKWLVGYGLARRDLSDVTAIGVDEIHFGIKNKYSTLVYALNEGSRRLLYVGPTRTAKSLMRFFLTRETGSAARYSMCVRTCGNPT